MRNECIETLEPRRLLAASPAAPAALPHPDHVVIVVEENKDYGTIFNDPAEVPGFVPITGPSQVANASPYIHRLARRGANLTDFHAETNPSQPNYLAMFSGSTQGVGSDAIPRQLFPGPSLGGALRAVGLTFAGYSEDLPGPGFMGETSGDYARKHNPWSDFADVPPEDNLPFSSFPHDFARLPTVSFVVPNQVNDMHSGTIRQADLWLFDHLRRYERWARRHNSLMVVTWDEGSGGANHIPTVVTGAGVRRGNVGGFANHYDLLRTIEDVYGLPHLGASADAKPLTDVFR
jgi:arylsulfatase A-like enzyme